MVKEPIVKPSTLSEATAVLLSVIAGSGIAWLVWLATNSIVLVIGTAGPIAALSNNFLRKLMTRMERS